MKLPANFDKPPIHVRHSALSRCNPQSLYQSDCPVCKEGVLLVRRSDDTGELLAEDNCILCCQQFVYDDIDNLRNQEKGTLSMGSDKDDGVSSTAPKIAEPVINDLSNEAAQLAWDTYSATVGGRSVSGDKLPTWEELCANPSKATVVAGWRAVANRQCVYWREKVASADTAVLQQAKNELLDLKRYLADKGIRPMTEKEKLAVDSALLQSRVNEPTTPLREVLDKNPAPCEAASSETATTPVATKPPAESGS